MTGRMSEIQIAVLRSLTSELQVCSRRLARAGEEMLLLLADAEDEGRCCVGCKDWVGLYGSIGECRRNEEPASAAGICPHHRRRTP